MDGLTLILSRWQFAITTVYHFFFVPLTLGLGLLVAILETRYVRTGKEVYKRLTRFWGKLFVINFAMGVVTGIVQEFQFGMNWSEYSRYVGDIFGAPLAIEALLAFFIESTFLGVWIFGWEKLSRRMHLAAIWLVSISSMLSALWILIANSFMQQPTGFVTENGRLVMTNFFALLTNPNVWYQFPHVLLGGISTGAFFMLGISAYHLIRKEHVEMFGISFRLAAMVALIGSLGVAVIGHAQGQNTVRTQPMKMAAAEALWETEDPAAFSLIAGIDEAAQQNTFAWRIPGMLSFLSYNRFSGEVKGIKELQAAFEADHGPGNYIPPVAVTFWSFRLMVGLGTAMILLAAYVIFMLWRKKTIPTVLLRTFPLAIALPFLANTFGWLLTEMGRQPWVVYDQLTLADAISPNLSSGMVLTSLIGFTLIYALLMAADVYLLAKYARTVPAHQNTRH
ncbi:MAG TPA: cytochrome ubiquinol oxidase subunit I [Anaerolineaceae bacterium]|nr:cytochrome ubiquinol oxidase subunit I [Anaerolineaceae bacterium]